MKRKTKKCIECGKDLELIELNRKRKEIIIKVLGQLHKGKISRLVFKDGFIFIEGHNAYEKKTRISNDGNYGVGDLRLLKDIIMRDIFDIAKKFPDENLSVLEFLMDKIDLECFSDKRCFDDMNTSINAKKTKELIKQDIEEIKQRCAAFLMLMQIEEN